MEISQNLAEENLIACHFLVMENSSIWKPGRNHIAFLLMFAYFFFLQALQPPFWVVFYSPLAGFSLLAYEVS